MATPAERPNVWLLYDGACGICSRWVTSWSGVLQRRGIGIAPLQSGWVQERTGLSPGTLLEDVRLLEPDGKLSSGAEAYRYLLRRIWWLRPLYLFSIMPGLRAVFDRLYRGIAQHRHQISAQCRVG